MTNIQGIYSYNRPRAADFYATKIMALHKPKFTAENVQVTLNKAEDQGLGTANSENIEIIRLLFNIAFLILGDFKEKI
jgi:hypothetical protein